MLTITKVAGAEIGRLAQGYKRSWVKCRRCGWVGYYDYLPQSLSNPIMSLGCPHDFRAAIDLSEADAVSALHAFRS